MKLKGERKTLTDIPGWKPKDSSIRGLIGTYQLYVSPDKGKIAQVHREDQEISLIFDRKKCKLTYVHPTTLIGMKKMGVDIKTLERILQRKVENGSMDE